MQLLEQVVKIEEITLGEDHPSRLALQNAPTGAYKANGQIEKTVGILERLSQIEVSGQNSQS